VVRPGCSGVILTLFAPFPINNLLGVEPALHPVTAQVLFFQGDVIISSPATIPWHYLCYM
jgi:hypothetical protein